MITVVPAYARVKTLQNLDGISARCMISAIYFALSHEYEMLNLTPWSLRLAQLHQSSDLLKDIFACSTIDMAFWPMHV